MPEKATTDNEIRAALARLAEEYLDPDTYFVVMANYYEHQATERSGQRVYMAHLWFREDSAWNVSLNERGLVCDVKLNPQDLEAVSRILIPVSHVWRIQKVDTSAEHGDVETLDWPERMHLRLPGQPELSE